MVVRRRYYIWLAKAYLKRWKKTIFASIILGGIFFFILISFFSFYLQPILERDVEKIGIWGFYNSDNLPEYASKMMSYGLTKIDEKGLIKPAAATSWEIKNDGKKYVFHLKKKLYFQNNEELTSENLNLNFKDVKRTNIDKYTVSYDLKSAYSPFLTTVAKPIFLKDYNGLGDYKFKKIELNAGFIKSITIQKRDEFRIKKVITVYPTEEALKIAYSLGEADEIIGLSNLSFKSSSLDKWNGVNIKKEIDYSTLVTLFYNNNDNSLSNKKLRQALNYALPGTFKTGNRASSPINPNSVYFSKAINTGIYDKEISKTLLESSDVGKNFKIEISTTNDYKILAQEIQKYWKQIGINSTIKIVNGIPDNFQVLLYPYKVPYDPDQYVLWHSDQQNNISNYKNLRIDKLLEDGRVISDTNERIKIYADFQKYLADDTPASFLYFPFSYTIIRS